MERGSHWWSEPPWWAWVVIAVGAVWLAVGLPFAMARDDNDPLSRGELDQLNAAASAANASEAAAAAAEEARIDIAALGDSYTGGSQMDSGPGHRWPQLLTEQYPWDVEPYAVGGTGFVQGSEGGQNFAGRVDDIIAAQPDVVIVAGGHNDSTYPPAEVTDAAADVLTQLHDGLPDARMVVLGVLWPGEAPPAVEDINDALRGLAGDVGATFIDPLAEGWFSGDNQRLIGPDGTHPTDEGHAALAGRIADALIAAGIPTTV